MQGNQLNPQTADAGQNSAIIDDGQFRFPVAADDLEKWEVQNAELTSKNYEQFCGDVKCSLPDVMVGSVEMIDVCAALIECGAKIKNV